MKNGFEKSGKQPIEHQASKNNPGSIAPGFVVSACPPRLLVLQIIDAFRKTMNAALGRAKDGEDQASEVEPIFGAVIKSLYTTALTKLLAKMPAAESKNQFIKSETRFLPNLI